MRRRTCIRSASFCGCGSSPHAWPDSHRRRSGRQGVAALDRRPDKGFPLSGRELRIGANLRRLARQILVFDDIAKPAGLVAPAEMIEPSLVVDSLGDLDEDGEVLRP